MHKTQLTQASRSIAARIAVVYVIIGAVWILFSDRLLTRFVHDPETLTSLQTSKGWLYALVTGGLLYLLILRAGMERDRVEAARRKSEEMLQSIIDSSTAMIYVRDIQGNFITINRQFEMLFHLTKEQVKGKPCREFFPKENADEWLENDRKVVELDAPHQWEEHMQLDDGTHFYLSSKFPLRDAGGKIYAVCGISTDITERKALEERLLQSQKMESVGRLAGGIAHDFNNLLTAITGYAEIAAMKLEPDSPPAEDIAQIQAAASRAAMLTSQLLAFARRQMIEPKVVNLNEIVLTLEKMLRRIIGEDIELGIRLQPDLWPVKADPGQMEQVLVNLAVNARDAMPPGGRLYIQTSNLSLEGEQLKRYSRLPAGEYAALTVCDTGAGMTEETKKHLFEPFFTTKERGKGTGLGLATC